MTSLSTETSFFQRGLRYNSTEGDEVPPAITATQPTTADESSPAANKIVIQNTRNLTQLVFFGTGDENTTFNVTMWGWSAAKRKPGVLGDDTVYVPILIGEWACTLSASVGVADGAIVATERIVDTIVETTADESAALARRSPTADATAYLVLDTIGYEMLEIQFDMTGATDANALYRTF